MARGEFVAVAAARVPSLLESKVVPPGTGELLIRSRLLAALDDMSGRKLTLLSAPCGYGKTSLLATWSEHASEGPVAWLGLDAGDDEPKRFLMYLAEAVERARPGTGHRGAKLMRAHGVSPGLALHEFLGDLAAAAPLAIVLDDLHAVAGNEQFFELLAYAIEHLPPGVRMIIGTRSDPPLSLGQLRGRGVLGELRAGALAFTIAEGRDLLVESEGLELGDEDVALLVERTEGWPVALYLAALWLRERDDPRASAHELAAGQRWVGEYLTDEIISGLDAGTKDFFVRSSVLTRLSAALCDEVLERDDSEETLHEVSRANLLVSPLDPGGEWFRVHRLFRELLQLQLQLRREQPGVARALHGRAAEWFHEHGFVEDAVQHALAAGDDVGAAAILAANWIELLRSGDHGTLIRLVDRLPQEVLLEHPELSAGCALATVGSRRPAFERARWLKIVEQAHLESPHWSAEAEIAAAVARAVVIDGDVGAAITHAGKAAELAEESEHDLQVLALAALAYALYLDGRTEEARDAATEAVALPYPPRRPQGVARALGLLALLAVEAGRIGDAEGKVREAFDFGGEHGLSTAASMHIAHLAHARILLTKGELREAEGAAELGVHLSRMPDPSAPHAFALLILADVRARRGRFEEAGRVIRDAERDIATFRDAGVLPRLAAGVRRRLRAAKSTLVGEFEPLSEAEIAVLRMLETDLSQREIGRQLFLSVNTIKTHSQSIHRKLDVNSRAEAVVRAQALGVLAHDDSPR